MSFAAYAALRNRVRRAVDRVRSRLVLRSLVLTIGFSGAVGILVIAASQFFLQSYERDRVFAQIREMILAVEGTARAAAFTEDPALAHSVAEGLLQNQLIAKVVIRSTSMVLVEMDHTQHIGHRADPPLIRNLTSPVDGSTEGTIEVYPELSRIHAASSSNTRMILVFLAFELFVMALAVAWAVFARVTRPITKVVDNLHHLKVENGETLQTPKGNEGDEIGRLVGDVNLMIARMQSVLLAERELRINKESSERKFRLIFENAGTGIFVLDADGRVISWNPAMARMMGAQMYSSTSEPPRLAALLGCDERIVGDLMTRAVSRDETVSQDFERGTGENAAEWFQITINPVSAGLFQGVCNDITERKRSEARVRALAERDALTGLLNRRGFEERARAMIRDAAPDNAVALLLADLDGFKQVNDSMGHDAGDSVLKHVVRVIESSVRKSDIVGRFGGDEFVVMLHGCASAHDAALVADKIVARLRAPLQIVTKGWAQVGGSVGVAITQHANRDFGEMLRQADEAMYAAKRAGKNAYRIWTETISADLEHTELLPQSGTPNASFIRFGFPRKPPDKE